MAGIMPQGSLCWSRFRALGPRGKPRKAWHQHVPRMRDTRVAPLATRTSMRLRTKEHAASELALREAWSPVPN